jgi:hypothetical protein
VQLRGPDAVEEAFDEREVHPAHELGLLVGQRVERAVGEGDVVAGGAGFVALSTQRVDDAFDDLALRRLPTRSYVSGAEVAAGFSGDAVQCLADGAVGTLGVRDGASQELSGQVVAALGQADFQITVGASVELGGAPGARTAATLWPSVLRFEEAVLDESVEVELGDMVGDADSGGGLVAADRRTLSDDEAVQGAPHRYTETGEPVEPSVEISSHISSRLGESGGAWPGIIVLPDAPVDEIRTNI